MKVLYEIIDNPLEIMDKNHSTVEELPLPQTVMEQLEQTLEDSYKMLPDSAKRPLPNQTMSRWKVALLDRFEHGGGS